jgi:hypothetical protein
MTPIENLICATLRGERPSWPNTADAITCFMERSDYHGVRALLHQHLDASTNWPSEILESCRQQAMKQAVWEMRHQHLLNRVLERLATIGIQPVLFKGTALAYSVYPESFLRGRGDTDLIVKPQDTQRVEELLQTLGFKKNHGIQGEFVSYQTSYIWSDSIGDIHTLDLHWKINNSEFLSKLFTYEELYKHAQPLPKLGQNALAVGPIYSIILACMHKISHTNNPYYVNEITYYGGDRLVWLYDIHLLINSLTPSQQEELVKLAAQKKFKAACLEEIMQAYNCLHTSVPTTLIKSLAYANDHEPITDYMNGSALYKQWVDFKSITGILNKLKFIAETFFPTADYMRYKYHNAYLNWLPWLYLHRIGTGLLNRYKSF